MYWLYSHLFRLWELHWRMLKNVIIVDISDKSTSSFFVRSFLGYHLYLISQGTTTNETYKWSKISFLHFPFLSWLFSSLCLEDAFRAHKHLQQLYINYLAIQDDKHQQKKEEKKEEDLQKDQEKEDQINKENSKIIKDVILIEMVNIYPSSCSSSYSSFLLFFNFIFLMCLDSNRNAFTRFIGLENSKWRWARTPRSRRLTN